jgi:signal transduction histidine kinase
MRISNAFAATGLAGLMLLLGTPRASALCLALPSPEFQDLDTDIERNPDRAIAAAQARLQRIAAHPDAFREAELLTIIAEARASQDRTDEARAVISAANARLDSLAATEATRELRRRLQMSEASVAWRDPDLAAAVTAMDTIIAEVPPNSRDRSCALTRRADALAQLMQLDRAAADAVMAYRLAEAGNWNLARMNAALVLTTIYRHSGLYADAERSIDQVVEFARSQGFSSELSVAEYFRGQVLIDENRFGPARDALEASRAAAEANGDSLGALFANVPLCAALVRGREFDRAEQTCSAGTQDFIAAGRGDVVTLLLARRAQIDLARGRMAAALAKLNDVLGAGLSQIPDDQRAQLFADRSQAHAALGQHRAAYTDLKRATDLERSAHLAEQARAVAVLAGASNAERLLAENHMLEERTAWQREQLSSQALAQRLATALAVAGALLSVLLVYLLLASRRHGRALRRQETILRITSTNAPDALMLLDAACKVRFANRPLFDAGPTPVAGRPLVDAVPAEAWPIVEVAVAELLHRRQAASFEISLAAATGEYRHYEVRGLPIVENGQLIGATLRTIDMTELRRLEHEIVEVASRERQKLGGELHEGLGQELAGISLLLGNATAAIERGAADAPQLLSDIRLHFERAIDQARQLARRLSPVEIELGSLSVALDRLAGEAERRLGIGISSRSVPSEIRVPVTTADYLYRTVEEMIDSAAKVGGCTSVDVDLVLGPTALVVTVVCDGGSASRPVPGSELARKLIAYRARLLGGVARFESAAAGDIRLIVSLPVDASPAIG